VQASVGAGGEGALRSGQGDSRRRVERSTGEVSRHRVR